MEPLHEFGKEATEKEEQRIKKQKRMKKKILKITALVVMVCAALFFWSDIKDAVASPGGGKKGKTKSANKTSLEQQPASPGISVAKKWDMPKVLTEISGLAYINNESFACVQDEAGTIYIYNTATNTIEKEIVFEGPGDYEGLTLVNETAWVLRADGKLFEVNNITMEKPVVKEYSTPLTIEHNPEGLCYDKKNNRLLVAIKNAEPGKSESKGIYSFDLSAKKMGTEPVFNIDLRNEVFANSASKKGKGNGIMPSAIAIHPVTGDMYITEGRNPKLLITDASGAIKKLFHLNNTEFAQPEGITFKPNGDLFISNEGLKQAGNILKIEHSAE